ncbi:MAG: TonB-dependent receptor domain-containing protein [bacterium]
MSFLYTQLVAQSNTLMVSSSEKSTLRLDKVHHETISLRAALQAVEKKFDVGFLYYSGVGEQVSLQDPATVLDDLQATLAGILRPLNLVSVKVGASSYVVAHPSQRSAVLRAFGQVEPQETTATIRGRITVEGTGDAIQGTQVVLEGTVLGDVADSDGNYEIDGIPPGKYTLKASFIGYTVRAAEVTVSAGDNLSQDFSLAEDVLLMEGVVTTASRFSRTQKEAPLSISLIDTKRIRQLSANSQADVLRTVPGVHAEGGGGEVAVNAFVRGLPAGGQYKYTPMQIDGMPVQGTFGLTSSAQDVYFRPDLGIETMEFVRGGSSTLFGVGSVAGIINYRSKRGGPVQQTTVQAEVATEDRYKLDFNTGGPLSPKMFYNLSGFYRFDEGPINTGLPTEGYQLRGNVSLNSVNGSFTIYGQIINDRVQFFLPLPLEGGSRERATGNDGEEVFTTQTAQAADISYATPDGIYETPIEDGVVTKGTSLLMDFDQEFGDGWFFNGKMKYARYEHQFNLFLTGPGGPVDVESQDSHVRRVFGDDFTDFTFTFVDDGLELPGNYLLFENRLLDRKRPFFEIASDISLSRVFNTGQSEHQLTLGAFLTRTEARDIDVITTYLGDFRDVPRLVDLQVVNSEGQTIQMTRNGLSNPGTGYTNNDARSSKAAIYLGDEIKFDRLRLDLGFRYEKNVGDIIKEGSQVFVMSSDPNVATRLQEVRWGSGKFNRRRIEPDAWGAAVAASYALSNRLNLYGNVSRGYFFPELRSNISFRRDSRGNFVQPDPDIEKIYQAEGGAKFSGVQLGSNVQLSGTAAAYFIRINDRLETDFINDPDNPGNVIQFTRAVGQSTTFGTELTGALSIARDIVLEASFTYQDHEVDDTPNAALEGKELRRQPKVMANWGLSYGKKSFDGRISGKFIGRRFSDNANNIKLDEFSIWRLDAGYTFPLTRKQTIRLGVHVFNLFDSDGVTEGDPRQGDLQLEGNFFVGRPILPRRTMFRATLNF